MEKKGGRKGFKTCKTYHRRTEPGQGSSKGPGLHSAARKSYHQYPSMGDPQDMVFIGTL